MTPSTSDADIISGGPLAYLLASHTNSLEDAGYDLTLFPSTQTRPELLPDPSMIRPSQTRLDDLSHC